MYFLGSDFLRKPASALFLVLLFVLSGCHGHPSRHSSPVPIVAGIEVHEHDALGSHLEIEVHLYDADSGELLACSGDDDGLAGVDESDVRYRVGASFVRPYHDYEILRMRTIENRALFVRVYEDDVSSCPSPAGPQDDFVGQSSVFFGEELHDGIVLRFDEVAYLKLAVSR